MNLLATHESILASRAKALKSILFTTEQVCGALNTKPVVVQGDDELSIWRHNVQLALNDLITDTIRSITEMDQHYYRMKQ